MLNRLSPRTDLEGDRAVQETIFPTGQCFDDAMEILVELLTVTQVPPEQLRLVHAIALLPDEGTPFAHAWVEHGSQCLFLGLYQGTRVLCTVPRQEYYQRLRVQHRTKYTPWQAARENERTVSCGPWKAHYRSLTRPKEPPC